MLTIYVDPGTHLTQQNQDGDVKWMVHYFNMHVPFQGANFPGIPTAIHSTRPTMKPGDSATQQY